MKNKISAMVYLFFFVINWAAVSSWALEPQQAPSPEYNALTKEEHNVIVLKGFERRFSGKYTHSKGIGTYICRRCNSPLFDSTHKFENDCGWPCFDDAIKDAVERSANGAKIELQCTNCGGHLGHQFLREDFTPKTVRNCVNSISLTFVAKGKELPGVILNNQNGIPKKPDANKNDEKASDQLPELEAQDSTPKASFEFFRNKLLEQLNDRDQEIVRSALSRLGDEYVHPQPVEPVDSDEYVEAKHVIGIKLSVKKQLVDLLDSAVVETRELAIQRLGELGPKADDALPKLRELLANSVSRTKLKAAEAIWRISGNVEESVTALVKLIRDDEGIGPSALWSIELMGPAAFSAFEAIEGLSKDPRDEVRETATRTLGSFGPQHKRTTEPPLKARLTDTSPEVRIEACLSLLKIGGELEEAVETLIDLVDRVIEKNSAPSKESPEERLVISAINALGQFQSAAVDAVLPISLHLNAKNLNVRSEAAQALGKIGPGAENAIPFLAKAMRDTESKAYSLVHFVVNPGDDAAKALGSIGIAAVPILLDSLNDLEGVVRARAARELGRIQDATRQTVGPLTSKLSDPNAGVRLEAIKSLSRLEKKLMSLHLH